MACCKDGPPGNGHEAQERRGQVTRLSGKRPSASHLTASRHFTPHLPSLLWHTSVCSLLLTITLQDSYTRNRRGLRRPVLMPYTYLLRPSLRSPAENRLIKLLQAQVGLPNASSPVFSFYTAGVE